jgi:hypothetical protein
VALGPVLWFWCASRDDNGAQLPSACRIYRHKRTKIRFIDNNAES